MDPVNFAYWLQSQFELNKTKSFSLEQTKIIKAHAQLVLKTVEFNEQKSKQVINKLLPPYMTSGSHLKKYKC